MDKGFFRKALCCAVSAAMALSVTAVSSFAYIDRGDVEIGGSDSYTLKVGETAELSVTPYEEDHYPGCGMAECPEICGEKNCIVEVNGHTECVCNGTDLVTYNAEVTAESSDSEVADVSYDGSGSVVITAKAAGEAEISVTAKFREYNDASKTVSVTVQADSSEQPGDGGDDNNGGNNDNNGGSGSGDNSGSGGNGGSNTGSNGSGGSGGNGSAGNGGSNGGNGGSGNGGSNTGDNGNNGSNGSDNNGNSGDNGNNGGTLTDPDDADKPDDTQKPSAAFTDVSGWAKEYIDYLADKGIVNGKTATEFAPNDSVTRAEFVKIIAGIAGADVSKAADASFDDVASGAWYTPYVLWAAENGIVTGNDGKFNPSSKITRQDMAVIITRYLDKLSGKKLDSVNDKVDFADGSQISSYASDAVSVMQQAGIISGKGNNTFAPKDNATRAEACKMLALVMQKTEA